MPTAIQEDRGAVSPRKQERDESEKRRSLADCLRVHEGEETLGITQIASEIGQSEGETRRLLGGIGVDCRACVVQCKGGKWSWFLSRAFWGFGED